MPGSRKRKQSHRWALQDAKNKLSEVVRAAEGGEPQIVTRRGVETAVVISHDDFLRLSGSHSSAHSSLAEALLAVPTAEDAQGFERVDLVLRDVE